MSGSNLSPQQFGFSDAEADFWARKGRTMEMAHPNDLLPHADTYEGREDSYLSRVDEIGASIAKRGYKPGKHGLRDFIHVVHQPNGITALADGNHRVHALNRIGYDKPVPVIVSRPR